MKHSIRKYKILISVQIANQEATDLLCKIIFYSASPCRGFGLMYKQCKNVQIIKEHVQPRGNISLPKIIQFQ